MENQHTYIKCFPSKDTLSWYNGLMVKREEMAAPASVENER